jgi:hypothetical protein
LESSAVGINIDNIESAISETEAEIARLNRALAALREAAAFLRERAASHAEGSDVMGEGRGVSANIPGSDTGPVRGARNDLAGMTLVDAAARILEDATVEGREKGLEAAEIASRALRRGYRSTSFRNPENDPRKIATSIRVMLGRMPDRFVITEGRIRLAE